MKKKNKKQGKKGKQNHKKTINIKRKNIDRKALLLWRICLKYSKEAKKTKKHNLS